jgi:hypothetical protein
LSGLPSKGTASLVAGIVSATIWEKTVRDRSIVTPERGTKHLQSRKVGLLERKQNGFVFLHELGLWVAVCFV